MCSNGRVGCKGSAELHMTVHPSILIIDWVGGEWLLDITIPERYPYVPPDMKFVTPICHPNVHFKVHIRDSTKADGRLEKFVLMSSRVNGVLLGLYQRLVQPYERYSSLLNLTLLSTSILVTSLSVYSHPVANLLRCGDQEGYDSLVRMYTHMYAKGRIKRQ